MQKMVFVSLCSKIMEVYNTLHHVVSNVKHISHEMLSVSSAGSLFLHGYC